MEAHRILLIDASPHARRMFTLALRSQGYEVMAVERADQIDSAIQETQPALILMDMKLTGASPYDICGRVRAKYAQLPLVLMAEREHSVEPVEQRWALSRGATDFVRKAPDQIEAILLRINQLVRSLSSVDRRSLQSALQALQTRPTPVVVQDPVLVQRTTERTGFLGSLQNAFSSIQTRSNPQPTNELEEGSVRYRGQVINRNQSAPKDPLPVSTPEGDPQAAYRGAMINRPPVPAPGPVPTEELTEATLQENEGPETNLTTPRRKRRRDNSLATYNFRSSRPFSP